MGAFYKFMFERRCDGRYCGERCLARPELSLGARMGAGRDLYCSLADW